MGRRKGAVNYKNEVLIKIVGELLPNGEYGWQAVAIAYQDATKEETSRDTTDLKKHWIKNLCNNMKKPTGRTGENDDRVHRCMAIEKKIMKKTHSGILGLSSDSDTIPSENKGVGGGGSEGEDDPIAAPVDVPVDVGNTTSTVTAPSPLRCSPRHFPPSPTNAGEVLVQQLVTEATAPPNQNQQPVTAATAPPNQNEEGMTPPPPMQVRDALTKAGSMIRASKTKNSSNKNKERTSIAGAIVKLIELQNRPPSSSGTAGDAAAMTMTLMRQMERINESMDERDRRGAKERRKERKRCKKRRAKKKAKKKAKKAKREAFAKLDDHGGKEAEGGQSSSDSSDSSDSTSDSDSSNSDSDSSNQSSNYGRGSWRRGGGTMTGGSEGGIVRNDN